MRHALIVLAVLAAGAAHAQAPEVTEAQRAAIRAFQAKFPTSELGPKLEVVEQRSRHVSITDGTRIAMVSRDEPHRVIGWSDDDLRNPTRAGASTSLFQTEEEWWRWVEERIDPPALPVRMVRYKVTMGPDWVSMGFQLEAHGHPAPGITPYSITLRRSDGKVIEYFPPSWTCRFEAPGTLVSESAAVQAAATKLGWKPGETRVVGPLRYVETFRFDKRDPLNATLAYCVQGPSGQVDVRARDGQVSWGEPQLPAVSPTAPEPRKASQAEPAKRTETRPASGTAALLAAAIAAAGAAIGWLLGRRSR